MAVHVGADLGVGYDDNVGNAAADPDTRDSSTVTAGVNLDYVGRLTQNTGLLLRAGVQGEAYEAADGLANGKLLVMSRLSHRPAGGFYTPLFAAWVSAALWEFDSRLRDGAEYRAGIFVTEPLTTAVSARLSFAAAQRVADSDVFELSWWSAGLNLDWRVLPALTLYGGYQFNDGDLVSSSNVTPKSMHDPPPPGTPGQPTPAVGHGDDALEGLFAYRLEAQTDIATLGFNVPVSPRVSVDAQVQRIDSATDFGGGYERLLGGVSVLMRFF